MASMNPVPGRLGVPRGLAVYEFGPFRFEPGESRLLREGRPVPLPPQTLETLLALVERSGSLITKQELMERVWPERFVEENNLAKCVSELRKALGDRRTGSRYIETVARRGYRFLAEVNEVRRNGAPAPLPQPASASSIVVHVKVELSPGDAGDPDALGRSVAKSVAAVLASGRGGWDRRAVLRRSTQDFHAYRLYREARCHVLRYTSASWLKSMGCYEQAIAQDPSYALAHADLAISSVLASAYYTNSEEVRQKARVAAHRALALDPGLAEAHLAMAAVRFLLDWDWDGAESSFYQALALDPEQAWSHDYYGFFLMLRGRFREALPSLERAVELNPVRITVKGDLGLYYHLTGALEGSIEHHRRALDLDPFCGLTRVDFVRTLERAGRPDEAIEQGRMALRLDDTPWVRVWLARAHAMAGRREEADRMLGPLGKEARRGPVSPVFPALVHAALGERAQAIELLEDAFRQRSPWMAFLRVEPGFDPLREDPRFNALLRRLGIGR